MTDPRRSLRRRTRKQSTARRPRHGRTMMPEQLEQRQLLAGLNGLLASQASPYQNPFIPQDVDVNGQITPADALYVINELNAHGSHDLSANLSGEGEDSAMMIDVNGNNVVEPADALLIINALNDAEGEGEIVAYHLRATNLNGDEITSVQLGETFKLSVSVQDQRVFPLSPKGVFAAYMDVGLTNSDRFEIVYGETQRITFSGGLTGGTYTLTLNGEETRPIDITRQGNASITEITSALLGLPSVQAGDVVVTIPDNIPSGEFSWDIRFAGNLAEQDVPTMLIDASGLTGTAIVAEPSELFPPDPTDPNTFRSSFLATGIYVNGKSAIREINEFSEVGGFDGLDELDPADVEYPVWEVTLRALAEGPVTFTPNEPEESSSATLVFGSDDPVPENMIDFGAPITVNIVTEISAIDDQATVAEDSGSNLIDVTVNDNSIIGVIQLQSVSIPQQGTAVIAGGLVSYTPNDDYFGADSFTYTINNGQGDTASATVNVTVTPVGDPPMANNDSFTVQEDSSQNFLDVLANDSIAPDQGETLTVLSHTPASNGTVTLSGGQLLYTPNANFFGSDSFTYLLGDGSQSASATVNITVENVQDAPVANNDQANAVEDSSNNSINLLANDTDPDGDSLSILSTSSGSQGGSLVSDGQLASYTPAADFFGEETFTYTITDGQGGTDSATVTITVSGTPDAPVANADLLDVDEASQDNLLDVLANDTDVDGDSLSVIAIGPLNNNGSATIAAGGSAISYTPDPSILEGSESFTYTISDGTGTSTATVTVDIVPTVRPRARGDSLTIAEDSGPATIDVLDNDIANDQAEVTLLSVGSAGNGSVQIDDRGTAEQTDDLVIYTPNDDFFGADSFTYVINDTSQLGADSTATVTISVTPVNDPPTLTIPFDSANTDEDTSLAVDGVNVADVDGDEIQLSLNVSNGSLTIASANGATLVGNGSGSVTVSGSVAEVNAALDSGLTYLPNQDYNGDDSLSLLVSDASPGESATIDLAITAVNDAPVNHLPGTQATPQDVDLVFSAAGGNRLSITDVDAGDGDLSLDLSVGDGTLSLGSTSGLTVTGDGTDSVSATGSLSDLNDALNGLTFTPDTGFEGSDILSMTVNDNGNSGEGGELSDSDQLTVIVTGINDPPAIDAPATAAVDEDSPLVFNNISISDPDAGSFDVQVDLSVSNGVLSLSGDSGLVVSGDGSGSLSATGSLADLNAALNGMTYTPAANYNGDDDLDIVVNDLGNTGEGGAQSDSHTVSITVNSVNDDPTALPDEFTVISETGPASMDVLANDFIAPDTGEELTIISVDTSNSAGSVAIVDGGQRLEYIPGDGFEGTDTFTYTISDGNGGEDTATVSVEVLSFRPSTFSGSVYIDGDSSGHRGGNERGLSGVEVTLEGVDFQGNPVSLATHTDEDGRYLFGNDLAKPIAPGTYTLHAEQASNMLDGAERMGSYAADALENDTFVFSIPQEGGVTSLGNDFGERGLSAPYLSLSGFLASQHGEDSVATSGILMAVDSAGNLLWQAIGEGWDGLIVVGYSAENGEANITLEDSSGDLYRIALPLDSELLRSRTSGGETVINLAGEAGDHAMTLLL